MPMGGAYASLQIGKVAARHGEITQDILATKAFVNWLTLSISSLAADEGLLQLIYFTQLKLAHAPISI